MSSKKLSKVDKAFLMVLAGVLSLGLVIQAGSGFSGVSGTFGIDGDGTRYVETDELNASGNSWFYDDVLVTGINELQFRDSDLYVVSSQDGRLDVIADNEVYLEVGVVNLSIGTTRITISSTGDAPLTVESQDGTSAIRLTDPTDDSFVGTSNGQMFIGFVNGISGSNVIIETDGDMYPQNVDNQDLGKTNKEWENGYFGTGRIYLWTDQGESIYSDGSALFIDGSQGVLSAEGNNTGAIGSDAIRWANVWATTITGKSLVTGKVIEMEIAPLPGEDFGEGDLVKIYDANYFTKTTKVLDYVIGVVVNNPQQIIVDTYLSWSLIPVEYENETSYQNVSITNNVYGSGSDPVACVAGKAKVKISEPVEKHDIIVAGADGIGRPFRTVLDQVKAQYAGTPLNWNNLFTVLEAFNLRMLGEVMEDSDGPYCWVMLW